MNPANPREKVIKDFEAIIAATTPTNHVVFEFLKNLYHYVFEDMFIIGEKDDFTVKKVEGDTYFDSHSRVLNVGTLDAGTQKSMFDALATMMFYYQYIQENPEDKTGFKRNTEKEMAYEYAVCAITKHFLQEFVRPDAEVESAIRKHGLIDDLLVIRTFSRRYIKLVEYEGDFERLLVKVNDTMRMYFETLDDTTQDAAMLGTMGKEGEAPAGESDQEELLKNLLENLTIE
ncbi:MAG: hypothetical protein JW839_13895 [Candidatus Lokiarchaeota archaeon]|nr:hypothetical protein [Candidatus Lokiarchaeota archaeon]